MYIELYLIVNFLMNLIMLRIAAALCSCRVKNARLLTGALAGAAYAVCAALLPWLAVFPLKLASGCLLAFTLPFHGWRGYLSRLGALFASAFLSGGVTVCLSLITRPDGAFPAYLPLGTALASFACCLFLPRAARRLVRRSPPQRGELVLLHGGREYRTLAIVDTGNSLFEPLSGLPVTVVPIPELLPLCVIPVPASTVAGNTVLFAFRPERMEFVAEKRCVLDSLAAAVDITNAQHTALIPPAALPA